MKRVSLLTCLAVIGLTAGSALASFPYQPAFNGNWARVTVNGNILGSAADLTTDWNKTYGNGIGGFDLVSNFISPTVTYDPATSLYNLYYYDGSGAQPDDIKITSYVHATSTDGINYTTPAGTVVGGTIGHLQFTQQGDWLAHGSLDTSGFPAAPAVISANAQIQSDGSTIIETWTSNPVTTIMSNYGDYKFHVGITRVDATDSTGDSVEQMGPLWSSTGNIAVIKEFWGGTFGVVNGAVYGPDSQTGCGLTRSSQDFTQGLPEPHNDGSAGALNDETSVTNAAQSTYYTNDAKDTGSWGAGTLWGNKGDTLSVGSGAGAHMEIYYGLLGTSTPGSGQVIRYRASDDAAGVEANNTWGGTDGFVQIVPASAPLVGGGNLSGDYFSADAVQQPDGSRRLYFASYDPNTGGVILVTNHTLNGDVNGDGVVDVSDLAILGSNWAAAGQLAADANMDGVVDVSDLAIVGANWAQTAGEGGTSLSSVANSSALTIPLPAALPVGVMMLTGVAIRRRRSA